MSDLSEHQQQSALEWVVREAKRNHLPYQIVGGLASLAHGGSRPLYDIDLYMPFADPHWSDFLSDIEAYVVWGPKSVVEGAWDLAFVKISYQGQKIEIGDSANLRIQDVKTGEWIEQIIDYKSSVSKTVLGCKVDVMPVDQLIAYKAVLGRDVDQQDIQELTSEHI